MSVVVRITGQVLGIATGDDIAPNSQITLVVNAIGPMGPQQVVTLTQSPTVLGALAVGQNVALYMATTSTDQSTIEGAVTVVSIDSLT